MKEKELRLALVCYGGVSLAVYMHGVTKEILKLARASKAYHAVPDLDQKQRCRFDDVTPAQGREHDTERVYFEILQAIGSALDLRVFVDVVAGASAGGINGVILARALAHDLSIDGLRRVWLEEADVARLLAPERKAGRWSKWFLRPLVWAYSRSAAGNLRGDPEMRRKLSLFLRSRWFRPPFDGTNLAAVLLDGIAGMSRTADPAASLLPDGQRLELFVTVTDFFGYPRRIPIHDPSIVREREHRHMLRFQYSRWSGGGLDTDFDDDGVPALAFASRATSSFPGAFPPAQIGEMDGLFAGRRGAWHGRARFLGHNFVRYREADMDPMRTSFLDGSVLNNKPFAEAIQSIRDRPAYRQVDRRLVYIDPNPAGPPPPPDGGAPGFLRTLKGALSDIPRQEPIYDDLNWVSGFNLRVRRVNAVIEATRPLVRDLVQELAPDADVDPLDAERIGRWRETANADAAREAGFAYHGYVRLKLFQVLTALAETLAELAGLGPGSAEAEAVGRACRRWAEGSGALPEAAGVEAARGEAATTGWIDFLRRFDLDFRRRRLRFVIQNLNMLYGRLGEPAFAALSADRLDGVKRRLYQRLDAMRQADDASGLPPELAARVRDHFGTAEAATIDAVDGADLDAVADALARALDLTAADAAADRLMAEIGAEEWPQAAKRELHTAYIGFAFWDVLTFSITNWRDLGEFDEIRVDRISPEDAQTIRQGAADATLKGIEFGHFGAFFSRGHRENDYLWGRLHAAERLIDLVYDAARLEGAAASLDRPALKRKAFEAILEAEAPHLTRIEALIASLRQEVADL
ncbi:MAG: patatin-like protein [Alphaproteobacteria bacterium]|nr:patatin-like protein [Alphaproteobacteria bacterium]